MLMLVCLLLAVLFVGLGFVYHVLWVAAVVGLVIAGFRLGRAGLNPADPAGRMNIGVLDAVGRYLVEVTHRARGNARRPAAGPVAVPVEPLRSVVAGEQRDVPPDPADRSRRVTQAMLVAAGEQLRAQQGREPTVAELAAHLGLEPKLILDALTVSDIDRARIAGEDANGRR
jgi:hypothetical protein